MLVDLFEHASCQSSSNGPFSYTTYSGGVNKNFNRLAEDEYTRWAAEQTKSKAVDAEVELVSELKKEKSQTRLSAARAKAKAALQAKKQRAAIALD